MSTRITQASANAMILDRERSQHKGALGAPEGGVEPSDGAHLDIIPHTQTLAPARARCYSTSALVVRDALHTLEFDGLLHIRIGAGGGAVVEEPSHGPVTRSLSTWLRLGRATLDQLTEARLLLEPEIARLAARRATSEDLHALDAVLAQRRAVVETGALPRLLDIQFHRALAEAARNPIHLVVVHALMDLEAEAVIPALTLSVDDNAQVLSAHEGILGAVRTGDASRAQSLMVEHVLDVQRRLKGSGRPGPLTSRRVRRRPCPHDAPSRC